MAVAFELRCKEEEGEETEEEQKERVCKEGAEVEELLLSPTYTFNPPIHPTPSSSSLNSV